MKREKTPVPAENPFPLGVPKNRAPTTVEPKHERVWVNRSKGIFSVNGKMQTETPPLPLKPSYDA